LGASLVAHRPHVYGGATVRKEEEKIVGGLVIDGNVQGGKELVVALERCEVLVEKGTEKRKEREKSKEESSVRMDMSEEASSDCSLITVETRPRSESESSCHASGSGFGRLWKGPKRPRLGEFDVQLSLSSEEEIKEALSPRRGRGRPRLSKGDGMSTDEDRPGTPVPVRGRGRPPTHGRYVGLSKARENMAEEKAQAKQKAEDDLLKEAAVARFRREARKEVSSPFGQRVDEKTAARLQDQVWEDLDLIRKVATKSAHLKGTFVRDLKDAAASIKETVEALGSRTVSDETRRLQADNTRLQAEMASLRRELAQLRTEMEGMRKQGSAHSSPDKTEEAPPAMRRRNVECPPGVTRGQTAPGEEPPAAFGDRQKTRRAHICCRGFGISPDTAKPPTEGAPSGSARSGHSRLAGQEPSAATRHPAGPKSSRPQARKAKEDPSSSSSTPPSGDKKKKKKKKKRTKNQEAYANQEQRKTQSSAEWTRVGPKARPDAKSRASKLRTPRSSAVILTLQPGAEERGATYAKVIAAAKARINAADIGAQGVRLRKAATGGRLFEFPGASSAEKADSLARKLREVLGDEVVRVSRPTKSVDLRITGLDDSVTSAEVIAAVATVGGCPVEQVRSGEVVSGYDGLGAVLVHCPVAAAKKVVAGGRLLVGWVSAQVKLLDARPLMCYRCLAPGHMGAQCKAGVDRSGLCYRCGRPGHKARECSATPHCVVCAADGRTAKHRVGSKSCVSPSEGQEEEREGRPGY
ncbi:jg7360, partial [Pararge aegeria aegeria]